MPLQKILAVELNHGTDVSSFVARLGKTYGNRIFAEAPGSDASTLNLYGDELSIREFQRDATKSFVDMVKSQEYAGLAFTDGELSSGNLLR